MSSLRDDLLYQLGTLDANVGILIKRAEKRDAEQKQMMASLEEIKTTLKPLVKDAEFMKPHVQHYSRVRGRAVWLGGFLLSAGGTLGGLIGNYLVKKYGA